MPTPNRIDKAKLKQELEVFGRKLRLMWHFRNDERIFDCNKKFRPKSTFNPKNKDVIIETYLSSLEEKLLDIEIPKDKFNNLSKEERDALYSLNNDNTIVILFKLEDDFGQVIKKFKVNVNFLFKLRFHIDRVEKKQQKIKLRKLRSLSPNSMYKKLLIERFYEHLPHFRLKLDFVKFCNSNVEDFENLFNILTLDNMPGFIEKNKVPFNSVKNLVVNRDLYLDFENNEREVVNSTWDFVSGELSEDNSNDSEVAQEIDDNRAQLKDNRLEGKFVSKNVINLSQRQLTKSEISLLSKGLKFVPTPNRIDKAKLKQELGGFWEKT